MSRFNHHPSREYTQLVGEIESSLDELGVTETTTAVADALEETLREGFKRGYNVDGTTDGSACVGRLVAGWNGCNHGMRRKGDDSDTPPHKPPHADHADLWLRDGEPAVYSMHLYDVQTKEIRDLLEFADRWGLEIEIHGSSWYYANRTVHIVLYPPELFEPRE